MSIAPGAFGTTKEARLKTAPGVGANRMMLSPFGLVPLQSRHAHALEGW